MNLKVYRKMRALLFFTCIFSVASIAYAGCGNGQLESGEQCDDGNTVSYDGCSSSCVLENANDWLCSNLVMGQKTSCCPKLTHPITLEEVCTCEGMEQPDPALGYYVNKICQKKDINECNTKPCHPNSVCVNLDATANCLTTYECRCPPGLHGNGKTTCDMTKYSTSFKVVVPDASMSQEEIILELKAANVIPEWIPDDNVQVKLSTIYNAPSSAGRRLLQESGESTQAEVIITSDSQETMSNVTESTNTENLPTDYILTSAATSDVTTSDANILQTVTPGFEITGISFDQGPNQWVVEGIFNSDMVKTLVSPFLSKVGSSTGPYSTKILNTFKVSEFPCLNNNSVCCLSQYVDDYVVGSFQQTVDATLNDCVDPATKTTDTDNLFDASTIGLSALSTLFANFPSSSIEFPTASSFIMHIFTDDITDTFATRTDRLDGTYELQFSIGMAFFQLLPSPDMSTAVSQTTITINVSPTMTFAFSSDTEYAFIDYLTVNLMQTKFIDPDLTVRKLQFARMGVLLPPNFHQNMDTGLIPLSSIRYSISQTFPDRLDPSLWTNPCYSSNSSGLYEDLDLRQLYTDADDQTCAFHYDLCANPLDEILPSRLNHFAFPIGNDTLTTAMLSQGYKMYITFDISGKDSSGAPQISSVFSESAITTTSLATSCDSIDSEMKLESLVSVNVSFGLVGTAEDWDVGVTTINDIMNLDQFNQDNAVDLGADHTSLATSMLTLCASARPTLQNSRVATDYYLSLDYLTSMHFLDSTKYDLVNTLMKTTTETGTGAYSIAVDEATGYHSVSFTSEATAGCFDGEDPTFTCGTKISVVDGVVVENTHVQPLHDLATHTDNLVDPPRWIAGNMLNENEFSLELGTNMTALVRSQFSIDNYMRAAWFINPGYNWPRASVGSDLETILQMADKALFLAVISLRETATGRVTSRRLLSINSEGDVQEEEISLEGTMVAQDSDNYDNDTQTPDLYSIDDELPSTNSRRLLATSVLPDLKSKPVEGSYPSFSFNIKVGSLIADLLDITTTQWAYWNFETNIDISGKNITAIPKDINGAIASRIAQVCSGCTNLWVTSVVVPPPNFAIASRRLLETSNVNIKVMASGAGDANVDTVTVQTINSALASGGFSAVDTVRTLIERSNTTVEETPAPDTRRYDNCGGRCWGTSPTEGIVYVFYIIVAIVGVSWLVNTWVSKKASRVTPAQVPMSIGDSGNIYRDTPNNIPSAPELTRRDDSRFTQSIFYLPNLGDSRHRGGSYSRV